MKNVNCLICKSESCDLLFQLKETRVVKCRKCSFVYMNPRQDDQEILNLYNKNYFKSKEPRHFGYADYLTQRPNFHKTFELRLRLLSKFKNPGKILDVGAGPGFFVEVAQKNGWEAYGIDISKEISAYAKDELGITNIFNGNFSSSFDDKDYSRSFDAITMWEYLEHSLTPEEDLKKAFRMLKDDGLLVIETHDIESWCAKIFKEKWWHLTKYKEHIYHFSAKSIRNILERNGFKVILITPRYCGKFVNIEFLIERSHLLGTNFQKLVSFLLTPIQNLPLYLNPWDEMIVIAKKT